MGVPWLSWSDSENGEENELDFDAFDEPTLFLRLNEQRKAPATQNSPRLMH